MLPLGSVAACELEVLPRYLLEKAISVKKILYVDWTCHKNISTQTLRGKLTFLTSGIAFHKKCILHI